MLYSQRFADDVLRALSGKSQRDVAQKARVSQTTISNWQRGQLPTNMDMLRRFAEAVGQDPQMWVKRAKLYTEEVHLRDLDFLTDNQVNEIMAIMEEAEEEQAG